MDISKKQYKLLKNGQTLTLYWDKDHDIRYTINLKFKDQNYIVNSYYFDGNDVMDDTNYKEEETQKYLEIQDVIDYINKKFPELNWDDFTSNRF